MKSPHSQLPLGLSAHKDVNSEPILVGAPNEDAVGWLNHWPKWPGPARALNIFGPKGSGKSRLARFFIEKSHGHMQTKLRTFSPDTWKTPHVILDNVDVTDQWHPESLFHLFNWIASEDGSLLIFSRHPVTQLSWGLADLESRLKTAATQEIYLPDDVFLSDYLQHLFAAKQCYVQPTIMNFILARIPRHFGFALKLVDRIDQLSLAQKKPISLKLVKTVLAELENYTLN